MQTAHMRSFGLVDVEVMVDMANPIPGGGTRKAPRTQDTRRNFPRQPTSIAEPLHHLSHRTWTPVQPEHGDLVRRVGEVDEIGRPSSHHEPRGVDTRLWRAGKKEISGCRSRPLIGSGAGDRRRPVLARRRDRVEVVEPGRTEACRGTLAPRPSRIGRPTSHGLEDGGRYPLWYQWTYTCGNWEGRSASSLHRRRVMS